MQNKIYLYSIIVLFIFTCLSCNTETSEPDDTRLGFVFFPLETGLYRVYQVEQTDYRLTGEIDISRYLLKEAVVDSFRNEMNEYTYILYRYTRSPEDTKWEIDSAWTAKKSPRQAIVTENNIPFVKLSFPFREGATWNGNSLNTLGVENYTMVNVNKNFTSDLNNFDNTVTIIHKDNEDTIISLDRRKEIYAQHVGLIYKEALALNYCAQVQCIGKGEIESGTSFKMSLLENGRE
ncbi:hypothetical protein BH23BAC1_BH23BAC1_27920 [soil metagenome]